MSARNFRLALTEVECRITCNALLCRSKHYAQKVPREIKHQIPEVMSTVYRAHSHLVCLEVFVDAGFTDFRHGEYIQHKAWLDQLAAEAFASIGGDLVCVDGVYHASRLGQRATGATRALATTRVETKIMERRIEEAAGG